jgi:predicted dehydrogenase
MSHLDLARSAIEQAIGSSRIGTPVSLRLVAHTTADHGRIDDVLAEALGAACDWLGGEPESVHASGGGEKGQTTALVRFAGGQTALVSAGIRGEGPPLFEAIVIGTRGVVAWEPDPGQLSNSAEDPAGRRSDRGQSLLRAVRASLASGGPVRGNEIGQRDHLRQSVEASGSAAKGAKSAPARGSEFARRPQTPPYGVLLVTGAHTHQENYAEALAADPRCRLIGLTDEAGVSERRARLNAQLARTLGIPLLPDFDAALARDDVHVVSICAEPERRARLMVRAAEAGKHLYLDKPLCTTLADAEAVVAAVRKAGVHSQMFSQVHAAPSRRARELVASGALGELVAVHCDLFFAKGPAGHADLTKVRRESPEPEHFETLDSKRELSNVGVYPLAFLGWLLGRDVKNVYAATSNYFFAEHQKNDMEDFALVLLELAGGVTASLVVGRVGWRSHPMAGVNRTYLVGTKASAAIDAYRPRVEVWADEAPWLAPPRHPDDPMGFWSSTMAESGARDKDAWLTPAFPSTSDASHFFDSLEQGRPSDVPADVAAKATEALLAAYRSAARGDVVGLPLERR